LLKKAIAGIILLPFLAGALFQLARIAAVVQERMQLDYAESIVLWQASQIFHLKSAFHSPQEYPHIIYNYTPFYHVVLHLLSRNAFLGDALRTGRLISAASALWVVLVLAWTVFRVTRGYASPGFRALAAAITCALALQVPSMLWVPLARVDMLGVALQFTALSLLIVYRFRWSIQLIAFGLLLLGVYTKQSLLAIPAAAILLLAAIRPVRAAKLAAGFVLAGAAVFFAFVWATDGGVIQHWIFYNVNPFFVSRTIELETLMLNNLELLVAAGLTVSWLVCPKTRIHKRLCTSPLRRAGLGFGLAVVVGFITSLSIGKQGSNVNYCLEWQLALCPLVGVFLVYARRKWQSPERAMALLRPLLLCAMAITGVQLAIYSWNAADHTLGWTASAKQELAARRREDAQMLMLLARIDGPVVSDNMMLLLRAGKPIPFDPAVVAMATETGRFKEGELLERTSNRFFSAFILRKGAERERFSPGMLRTISRNYQVYSSDSPSYTVLVPVP
jgi:hypothetical protein